MRNDLKKVSKVILRDSFDSTETGVDDASADERIVVLEKNDVEQRRDGVLAQLLEQITGGCRQVLNLYYYEAFSMAQIADERGLAGAHQAKKAADRCRGQLRDLIGQNPQLAVFLKESMR
jgi:DNA-directed RNA polymerase specialized sigma24 family protein